MNIKKLLPYIRKHGIKQTLRKIRERITPPEKYTCLPTPGELARQRGTPLGEQPLISILVPLYNTPERFLRELIASVQEQTYTNWELCLADAGDASHPEVEEICGAYAKADRRIRYEKLPGNGGISENTNACARLATGEYLALLDHDDMLCASALYEMASAINRTHADILYSDEDHLSVKGEHVNPFFKPDWSPELLHCQMYIGHLLLFRRRLFEKVGGFDKRFDGAQDYDLMLRLSEETTNIVHVPKVLYFWRESENSTAANAQAKPYAHTAGQSALDAHLKRRYGADARAGESEWTFVYDPRFPMQKPAKVSVIIPMKDRHELTADCIRSILEKTVYPDYEILILDNRSEKPETKEWLRRITETDPRIRVAPADMEFNWSGINNHGAALAAGDVFIFLNNDTLVITPDWMERLAENALRPDVGVVGALLLYPDDTIQHAGVVVGMGGWADHVFKGMEPVHFGAPYVSPMLNRNVLAVTGACMCISKEVFRHIGGFDEGFIICGSDVEICLRAHTAGLSVLYDAFARLYHLESKSRDSYIPPKDFEMSAAAYAPYVQHKDPFYNPNLSLNSTSPALRKENE